MKKDKKVKFYSHPPSLITFSYKGMTFRRWKNWDIFRIEAVLERIGVDNFTISINIP